MKDDQDFFNVLRQVQNKPKSSQRDLANDLGFSLGKINYCLRELKKKGIIKIENFSKSKKKINYVYLLTPQGISQKMKLTVNFMKRKMKEYEELQKEHQIDKKRK